MARLFPEVACAVGCALVLGAAGARAAEPPRTLRPPKTAGLKPTAKPSTSRAGRATDVGARRSIAGGGIDDASFVESPELRALHEAERELFPPASPSPDDNRWPGDLPPSLGLGGEADIRMQVSGLPPSASVASPATAPRSDPGWPVTAGLEMPDLPVRWDERVVRYLEFFRDDPRGRATFASLFRRSGRWRDMIRRVLRRKSLPEDLVWLAMIESGFDSTARSGRGAAGLWQFMPDTARIYGLAIDHWVDERLAAQTATEAATEFLADLHRRFGSWDLAVAGYNMGYSGLASVVRRYNTNDFWSLARTEGTLPWETTLYVPKVLAAAVVAHNLSAFGFSDLAVDSAVLTDDVGVPPGTLLSQVAQAAGCSSKDLEALNPELRAGRTPPRGEGDVPYSVRVPLGRGETTASAVAKLRKDEPLLERYVIRFGETLEQIAASHKTTTQRLVELNTIGAGETLRGGTVLLVPVVEAERPPANRTTPSTPKTSVVVPSDEFVYPDRKRVFYRVLAGDRLVEIGAALHVPLDDLRRWNELDPSARLQEGMTLQAFVAPSADLSQVAVLSDNDVRVLVVGSEEFFAVQEHEKAFKRVLVAAKSGDTLEAIGKRFDVSARTMERVNRRGRSDLLDAGSTVVVYVPARSTAADNAVATASTRTSNGIRDGLPLRSPSRVPVPDLLP